VQHVGGELLLRRIAITGEVEEIRHFIVDDSLNEPNIAIGSKITVSKLDLYARGSKALERFGGQYKKGQQEKAASSACPKIPPQLFPRRPRLLALPFCSFELRVGLDSRPLRLLPLLPCCPSRFMIGVSGGIRLVLALWSALADLCLLMGSATLGAGFIPL